MKLFCIIAIVLCSLNVWSQVPQGINYQAVIRNQSGVSITNTLVSLKIDLIQNIPSGQIVYSETHSATTSIIGLVNFVIGTGNVLTGTFNTIDWGNGPYFVQVSVDINGGSNFTVMGTQQLMSVPYALYAENTANPGPAGPQGNDGVGIVSTVNNGNGTYTFNYSDGSSFTTSNLTGPSGAQGIQGPAGPQGASGTNGLSAYQVAVNNGFIGTEGQWLSSLQGAQGPAGATGPQGPAGPQGASGTNGTNGLSAYQIAVNNGFIGTENQWLSSLQGPSGAQGVPGNNGYTSLMLTTTEPAGSNCANGGVKIQSGIDSNSNGTLETTEINPLLTKYVCNGVSTTLPSGTAGQTLYHNGTNWTATSNLYNSGSAIGIGTTNPNASSIIDLQSTSQGLLLPRMSLSQRNGITTPATGLLIFQTDNTPGFYYFNGSVWVSLSSSGSNNSSNSGETLIFTTDGF